MSERDTIEALRQYGWLRDDGDGERMHQRRGPADGYARTTEERCNTFHNTLCAYKKGHRGTHRQGACVCEVSAPNKSSASERG